MEDLSREKKGSAVTQQEQLLKEAYELGFEVGYRRHSEIGWVRESFLKLQSMSKELSLGNSVSLQYQNGKQEGIVSREKGLKIDVSADASLSRDKTDSAVFFSGPVKKDTFVSGFRSPSFENIVSAPVEKPRVIDIPQCTSLGNIIARPSNIKGFRPLFLGKE